MKATTRFFGEIEIADDKIITMDKGIIGFPDLKHFALIFNEEKKDKEFKIMWLQSMDDGDIAFPVIEPNRACEDYQPQINMEIAVAIGEFEDADIYMISTVPVPSDVNKMTRNLQAPFLINTRNNKAIQVIVENDYPVRYSLEHLLQIVKEVE